jgi:hypothetical protein
MLTLCRSEDAPKLCRCADIERAPTAQAAAALVASSTVRAPKGERRCLGCGRRSYSAAWLSLP